VIYQEIEFEVVSDSEISLFYFSYPGADGRWRVQIDRHGTKTLFVSEERKVN